ncbi:MAG: ABC transporter ATP-binding protein [Gemmatimonadaceae bacterium]|nr:ABC transporter ATP-binding protein [Gemmatimonadaceae bacterium]
MTTLQQAAVSLRRTFEYLDSPVEQPPASSYVRRSNVEAVFTGDLVFEAVSACYSNNVPALRGISLTCSPGQITCVVGSSGAGKSSLLRAVPRLLELTSGTIRIGKHDTRTTSLHDLRNQIAYAPQEPAIIRGTLRQNLTLGMEAASEADIDAVLEACVLGPLCRDLPYGLDTAVAEWGASLSGGQRQRISLARALLRNAHVLLLDEITANLDPATENEIVSNLQKHYRNRILLMVTHRPTVAERADQVVSMVSGKIEQTTSKQSSQGGSLSVSLSDRDTFISLASPQASPWQ